jgi:hypothetical protein
MNETATMRQIIGGAIYDFAARLTCRKEPITLGSAHNAAPAAEACDEFLKLRGCDDGEPLVRTWQEHLGDGGSVSIQAALGAIKAAMQKDYDYAWSWHCVMACAAQDEGLNHEAGNRAAARLMRMAFDIDTSVGDPSQKRAAEGV